MESGYEEVVLHTSQGIAKLHVSLKPYAELVTAGYLSTSEKGPLILFNYTEKCTFDKHWNEYTLASRGIVFEKETGKCVARPFGKFFNLNENALADEKLFDWNDFETYAKMDGSLGIMFYYEMEDSNGQLWTWHICTRGSFYSEQAQTAQMMLERRFNLDTLCQDNTYLFEIIYPGNRIVVNYGSWEDLSLLAARDTVTGIYYSYHTLCKFTDATGFHIVPKFDLNKEEVLKAKTEMKGTEDEGFVLVWKDGTRVKVKADDYCRLAKIISHLSPLSVWEAFVAGKQFEYLQSIPEEILPDALPLFEKLSFQVSLLTNRINQVDVVIERNIFKTTYSQKEYALEVLKQPKWMHSALFARSRREEVVLKLLRPDSNKFREVKDFT